MSRQLKLSATLSVLAMVLFAAVGSHTASHAAGVAMPRFAAAANLPAAR